MTALQEKNSIRLSTTRDINTILKMFDNSRRIMRESGNFSQWIGYPTTDDVADDINRGVSFLILDNNDNPIGTFALVPGIEPTYSFIDHGRWIDTTSAYCTLHRLAAMPGVNGIADIAFRYAKQQSAHLRVDTHHDNKPMRHILEKEHFVYCGIIYMPDGGPRDAYEWWRYDEVEDSLKEYVENEILPRYNDFDMAHRQGHIRRVIARAMQMQSDKMVYTAAAMHDLGIAEGRDIHHIASGRIIRSDIRLKEWFEPLEIEAIACAAEDHRASANSKPRQLLGCIIAEADRDIEPEYVIRRTVQYSLDHYPDLDINGHWHRSLSHLNEKYADGGYMKLWLENSPNWAPLNELRAIINNTDKLHELFLSIYKESTSC